jgi:hypothetical protein
MRGLLLIAATERRTITYGELARSMTTVGLTARSRALVALLNDACGNEAAEGRPMLGSVVVAKTSGMPGAGYFRAAHELGRDVDDERDFWERELERVFEQWSGVET